MNTASGLGAVSEDRAADMWLNANPSCCDRSWRIPFRCFAWDRLS